MTRAEKLLLALSDIRPDWVLDAAPKNTLPETGPRPRRSKVKYWGAAGALAACLLLAFWGREALGGGTPPAAAPQTPPAAAASPAPTTAPSPAPENDALSNTQLPSGAALDELLGELGTRARAWAMRRGWLTQRMSWPTATPAQARPGWKRCRCGGMPPPCPTACPPWA